MRALACLAGLSAVLAWLALVPPAAAQKASEAKMDLFTPGQFARGCATDVTVRVGQKAVIQSAEVAPPEGVTVSDIRVLDEKGRNGMKRWSLRFMVDGAAEPGPRTVVPVTSKGATAPQAVEIPPHVPELSDLVVSVAQMRPLNRRPA